MTIAEQLYTLVKDLPQDKANEILTFAESIYKKHLNTKQSISEIPAKDTQSTSFRDSLRRLNTLTQDFPSMDPVAIVQAGREELDERNDL